MAETSGESVKVPKVEKLEEGTAAGRRNRSSGAVAKKAETKPKAEAKKTAKAEEGKPKTENRKPVIDAWSVIKVPYLTEKSTRMIESQNKLVFLVKERATKSAIKAAVEAAFSVKVAAVNTTSTMRGEKKAYVKLKPEFKAIDIATKLGMM